jgi:hypothetical protein
VGVQGGVGVEKFPFFPCNPLKFHETTKEKLANSKEKLADSKKMLGKKKEKLGGAGNLERAPPRAVGAH